MTTELERRLAAADKTIEVLKTKVHDLYNKGTKSGIHEQLEAARRREDENRRRREMFEMRAADLEAYSHRLEGEVEERTRAIKTILDNVTFGFLVVDQNMVVQPGYTKSCYELLGSDVIEGRTLGELLGMDESAAQYYLLGLDQVFEDLLPEEVSIDMLASRFTRDARTLKLDARVVRGADDEVEGLLLSISDVTALEVARRQAEANRMLVSILRQKSAFQMFLSDSKVLLARARAAVEQEDSVVVRRMVHTIKGNAASYSLEPIVEVAHAIEENAEITGEELERLRIAFVEFLAAHEEVLGLDFDDTDERYSVSGADMSRLRDILDHVPQSREAGLDRWADEVLQLPVRDLVGPVDEFVGRLAGRLGKEVQFEFVGRDTPVHAATLRPVCQVLSHLVRNALDHGIEPSAERGSKPGAGSLRIAVEDRSDAYHIEVADDGRGVAVEDLAQKAAATGLVDAGTLAGMTGDDRLELVFVDALSRADETTSTSGRGVGMSAVRAEVERQGGAISIVSQEGRGTTVALDIPKPASLRLSLGD